MRVYLPSTLPGLRRLLDTGELGAVPLPAYTVSAALREWYAEGDEDELEYAALSQAARASVRLLDDDPAAPRRRVVIAADVPAATPRPDVDRAAVQLSDPVPLGLVRAVHVDAPDAVPDVTAAVDAQIEADLGGTDAAFAVEQAEGHELQWFATQEIGPLLELG